MKNNTLLTLFFLCFLTFSLFAQNPIECGFQIDNAYLKIIDDPGSDYSRRLKFLRSLPLNELYRVRTLEEKNGNYMVKDRFDKDPLHKYQHPIPVVVHVVRQTNGTGGLTQLQVDAIMDTLNFNYQPYQFQFVLCALKFINNTSIYNNQFNSNDDNASNGNASYNVLNVLDRNMAEKLNVYIVQNANTSWAWRPNSDPLQQHIVVKIDHTKNRSSFTHEVGHWLGLMHTHGNSNGDDQTDELVRRTGCSRTGDRLCDTPADPNLSAFGSIDDACNFIHPSNLRDANGDAYTPDTRNFMSYSEKHCRVLFSNDQVYVMYNAYLNFFLERGYFLSDCGEQKKWRWCVKCQGLFYSSDGNDSGVCPAGNKHTPNPTATDSRQSGKYMVDRGDGGDLRQSNWRWCVKCQGMFYASNLGDSGVCPSEGMHTPFPIPSDSRRSGLYSLDHNRRRDPTSIGQQGWKWCFQCQGLFYANTAPESGVCPATKKQHKAERSGFYAVKME